MTEHRSGIEYLGPMPDWWDSNGRLATYEGQIVIAHPDHPPMIWVNGHWKVLEPGV